jgi:phosphatidylglycerol:prolipoprotein diacylglycerol transferase
MYPELITLNLPVLGQITITTFGVMMAIAFLSGFQVIRIQLKQQGRDEQLAGDILLGALVGGILGAKIYYVLLNWAFTVRDPAGMLFSRSGLVWYGGLIGGALGVIWIIRRRGQKVAEVADVVAPALALSYALGRVGCFLVGDDYGRPTDSWVGIAFPNGQPPSTAGNLRRGFGVDIPAEIPDGQVLSVYPTQLFEVGISLVIFFVLWRLRAGRAGAPVRRVLPRQGRPVLRLAVPGAGDQHRVDRPGCVAHEPPGLGCGGDSREVRMACRRTAWRTLAVGIALIAIATDDAAGQTFADPEVVGITFQGNEAFPAGDLESAILTSATRCRTFLFVFPLPLCPLTDWGVAHIREYLDEGELPLDVLRLRLYYRQRGFRAATVDTTIVRQDEKVRIQFDIQEGEPTRIRTLAVLGGEELLDSAMVSADLSLALGDPLDLVALGDGERRLAERLRKDGYVHAQVLREYFIPTESLEADVGLRVEPGPRVRVGEVRIVGSGEVGDDVIQELVRFESGDWFSEDQIVESQRSLYSLQALRWANISSEQRADTDTLIDLKVEVAPAPKRSLQAGAGLQTDECVQGQASLIYRNFLGDARILRFTGRVSNLFASQLQGQFPCTDVSSNEVYQELNYLLEVCERACSRSARPSRICT